MKTIYSISFLVFLLILSLPAAAEPFFLGVVRADKTIVPFALFDGASWSNPWPKGYHQPWTSPDTTITEFRQIPKTWYTPLPSFPREWYVRNLAGAFSTVKVTRPVVIYSWCMMYWGILIGNAEIPVNTHRDVPKEGFAASANIQTDPVPAVEKGSAEWECILAFIRPLFEKTETDKGNPLPATDRAKAELVVIRLDRALTGPDGGSIIHFEIERDYGKANLLPSRSDYSRSQMSGWIAADRTGSFSFITNEFHHEPNWYAISNIRITLLGTITIGGKRLWIVRKIYYESESYAVLEVTLSGVKELIDTLGGGC